MDIKSLSAKNYAQLAILEVIENRIIIGHYNKEDDYYYYEFLVTGTKSEIDIIKAFCEKINTAAD